MKTYTVIGHVTIPFIETIEADSMEDAEAEWERRARDEYGDGHPVLEEIQS